MTVMMGQRQEQHKRGSRRAVGTLFGMVSGDDKVRRFFGEAIKKAEGNKDRGLKGINLMWDERGYVGEPFARPAETCAQEGASQPNLQCLKVAKEKRIVREDYGFRGQKQTGKTGVRCRRQGGDRMKREKQTGGKTGDGKCLLWSFRTHRSFSPQEKLPIVRPAKKGEAS
jgi:hypothetical protein